MVPALDRTAVLQLPDGSFHQPCQVPPPLGTAPPGNVVRVAHAEDQRTPLNQLEVYVLRGHAGRRFVSRARAVEVVASSDAVQG